MNPEDTPLPSTFFSNLVTTLSPYVPGEQSNQENLIKLNTNENPFPPSPKALAAMQETVGPRLTKYPDPESVELREAIATLNTLDKNQVFIGNGSDEVLAFAFMALFKKDRPLVYPDISYSFYPTYAKLVEIHSHIIPLRADFSIAIDDYLALKESDIGGIIFANPNAPTGLALSTDNIKRLLNHFPNTPIVVDEAYAEFSEESAIQLINDHSNLLVTRTLSKSYGLAGLRVGYGMAQEPIIDALSRVKNSFNSYPIDCIAQAGAQAAIEDQHYLKQCVDAVKTTRHTTTQALRALGFEVIESSTNFIFAYHPDYPASDLHAYLRSNNIMVRYFSKPRIDNHLRISVGTDEQMQRVIECLKNHIH